MGLNGLEQEAVDLFWQMSGDEEPFPRMLERSLALALPLALVKLPGLRLWDVEKWMQQRGNQFRFSCKSRRVRGCLIAHAGQGLVFMDGRDSQEEQRWTLAHEISHFLVDYWLPRGKAVERFGHDILDVLDGRRQLTMTERVHALLIDMQIGPYQSFMDRSESGTPEVVWHVENRADRIALALLAPPEAVLPHLHALTGPYPARLAATATLLCREFGLPRDISDGYARTMLLSLNKGPSWLESFGLR